MQLFGIHRKLLLYASIICCSFINYVPLEVYSKDSVEKSYLLNFDEVLAFSSDQRRTYFHKMAKTLSLAYPYVAKNATDGLLNYFFSPKKIHASDKGYRCVGGGFPVPRSNAICGLREFGHFGPCPTGHTMCNPFVFGVKSAKVFSGGEVGKPFCFKPATTQKCYLKVITGKNGDLDLVYKNQQNRDLYNKFKTDFEQLCSKRYDNFDENKKSLQYACRLIKKQTKLNRKRRLTSNNPFAETQVKSTVPKASVAAESLAGNLPAPAERPRIIKIAPKDLRNSKGESEFPGAKELHKNALFSDQLKNFLTQRDNCAPHTFLNYKTKLNKTSQKTLAELAKTKNFNFTVADSTSQLTTASANGHCLTHGASLNKLIAVPFAILAHNRTGGKLRKRSLSDLEKDIQKVMGSSDRFATKRMFDRSLKTGIATPAAYIKIGFANWYLTKQKFNVPRTRGAFFVCYGYASNICNTKMADAETGEFNVFDVPKEDYICKNDWYKGGQIVSTDQAVRFLISLKEGTIIGPEIPGQAKVNEAIANQVRMTEKSRSLNWAVKNLNSRRDMNLQDSIAKTGSRYLGKNVLTTANSMAYLKFKNGPEYYSAVTLHLPDKTSGSKFLYKKATSLNKNIQFDIATFMKIRSENPQLLTCLKTKESIVKESIDNEFQNTVD